jgi:phage tail-like protein
VNGQVDRRDGSIILQDDLGNPVVRWNFFKAWPSKYAAPEMNAKGNEVAIDSLTVSCERFERVL